MSRPPTPDATVAARARAVPRSTTGLVFAACFALYAASVPVLSDGQILGNDVVPYAAALTGGEPGGLWNAHHLASHPLALALSALLELFGVGAGAPAIQRALLAQQLVSATGGALAVALLFRFTAARAGVAAGAALAAVLACSAGHWFYASVGETYTPANAALLGLLATALEQALGERDDGPRSRLVLLGWLLAAVLLRQDSVLVVPALFVLLAPRAALSVTAGAGLAALGLYAAAWQLAGAPAEFVPWLRGLADTGLWGAWAGPLALAVGAGSTWTALAYAGITFVGPRPVVALWGLLACAAPALLALACWVARRESPPSSGRRRCLLGLFLFAALRLVFFAWWQPANMEYHTGTWVPLLLAVAVVLPPASSARAARGAAIALAAASLALLAGNVSSLIAPARGELLHQRATRALYEAGENGVLVSLDAWARYALQREGLMDFADATALMERPEEVDAELVARVGRALEGGRRVVFFRDTALPPIVGGVPWALADLSLLLFGFQGEPLEDPVPDASGPWGWLLDPRG